MNSVFIDWNRCPDGVELVDADAERAALLGAQPPTPPVDPIAEARFKAHMAKMESFIPAGSTALSGQSELSRKSTSPDKSSRKGMIYQARSDALVPTRHDLMDLENPIAVLFLNARTTAQKEAFFSRVGMLYPLQSFVTSEDCDFQALAIKNNLNLMSAGYSQLAVDVADDILSTMTTGMRLDYSKPNHPPRIAFRARSLLDYMKMECVVAATSGARLRECENCHVFFMAGPMTGWRIDRQYCSDACRTASMRSRKAALNMEGKSDVNS